MMDKPGTSRDTWYLDASLSNVLYTRSYLNSFIRTGGLVRAGYKFLSTYEFVLI
jgi:hypothetical protein